MSHIVVISPSQLKQRIMAVMMDDLGVMAEELIQTPRITGRALTRLLSDEITEQSEEFLNFMDFLLGEIQKTGNKYEFFTIREIIVFEDFQSILVRRE